MVSCINKGYGCTWDGPMKDLKTHLLSCEVDLVPCPEDCGENIRRSNCESHIKTQCSKLTSKCDYCGKYIQGGKLKSHNTACLKFQVQCPFLCNGKLLPRDTLDTHLREECLLNLEKCIFSATGCHYNGPVFQHQEHVKNYSEEHLMLACCTIAEMEDKINNLSLENAKINKKYESVFEEIRDLNAIMWKITGFTGKVTNQNRYEYYGWDMLKPSNYHVNFAMHCEQDLYGFYILFQVGTFDGSLEWPFRKTISITVENAGKAGKSCTIEYTPPDEAPAQFQKPVGGHNLFCIGSIPVKDVEACLQNDSLLIKINIF